MIIADGLIIKKLGFKIERWILYTIFSYTGSAMCRAIESILLFTKGKSFFKEFMFQDLFVEASVIISWTVMYYVIFRIQFLRERI